MFVAHYSDYMNDAPKMKVLKAKTPKNAIIEAFGIRVFEGGDDVDTIIAGAIEGNGDGMPYITILDTKSNKTIIG